MKPRVKPQDSGGGRTVSCEAENIINMRHELVRLGDLIDWTRLEAYFAPYYSEAGRPGLPIRLVVGLHLLKHIEGLSDEAVCERWERRQPSKQPHFPELDCRTTSTLAPPMRSIVTLRTTSGLPVTGA